MFGLLRGFSVDADGGRSLVLHGSTEGSMLGTGRRDADRFLHSSTRFHQTKSGVFLIFSMFPWQVLSTKIRSLLKEADFLLSNEYDGAVHVTQLRCV